MEKPVIRIDGIALFVGLAGYVILWASITWNGIDIYVGHRPSWKVVVIGILLVGISIQADPKGAKFTLLVAVICYIIAWIALYLYLDHSPFYPMW